MSKADHTHVVFFELDMRSSLERYYDELALAGLVNRQVPFYARHLIKPAIERMQRDTSGLYALPWMME